MGGGTATGTGVEAERPHLPFQFPEEPKVKKRPTVEDVASLARVIFELDAVVAGEHVVVSEDKGAKYPLGLKAMVFPLLSNLVLFDPALEGRALQFARAYEQRYMPYSEGELEIVEKYLN